MPLALVIFGLPRRRQGEIDLAVAVDVVGLDADVVVLGRPLDDRVLFPPRVGEPDDRVLGHGHDVELAVAVDVGGGHRVADLADVGIDLLSPERRELGRPARRRRTPSRPRSPRPAPNHSASVQSPTDASNTWMKVSSLGTWVEWDRRVSARSEWRLLGLCEREHVGFVVHILELGRAAPVAGHGDTERDSVVLELVDPERLLPTISLGPCVMKKSMVRGLTVGLSVTLTIVSWPWALALSVSPPPTRSRPRRRRA